MSTGKPAAGFPALEAVRELPLQLEIEVPADWEDRNGHVGVRHYQTLFAMGAWRVLEEVGVDEEWLGREQCSQFNLEHHLFYRSEIRVGDIVSTYNRVLGRSARRFHGIYLVINETRGCLAATLEYITANIDMKGRRMAVFPEELAGGLDWLIDKHRQLSWDPPVCGFMSP